MAHSHIILILHQDVCSELLDFFRRVIIVSIRFFDNLDPLNVSLSTQMIMTIVVERFGTAHRCYVVISLDLLLKFGCAWM